MLSSGTDAQSVAGIGMNAAPVAVDVEQLPKRLGRELAAGGGRHLLQDVCGDRVLDPVRKVSVFAGGHVSFVRRPFPACAPRWQLAWAKT